jgi:16S rRNA (adenine1518-N6/adenine1519-N6)-dimethyltransferase
MNAANDFEFPPIRALLDELGIRLSRHKDQHFLRNPGVTRRIAELAELTPEDAVLEVGAGLGNLSTELARRAGTVVSVEMDQAFRAWHERLRGHFPNLEVRQGDFLKFDLAAFAQEFAGRPLVIAGNLPYQITAPILFKCIDSGVRFRRLVFMVQLEVAERMAAGPGTRQASALTYKLALLHNTTLALRVAPREFLPPPRVESAVVVLTPRDDSPVRDEAHRERLFRVITGVFMSRRKSLSNGMLVSKLAMDRASGDAALRAAGIDPGRRAETLTLDEVVALEAALPGGEGRAPGWGHEGTKSQRHKGTKDEG